MDLIIDRAGAAAAAEFIESDGRIEHGTTVAYLFAPLAARHSRIRCVATFAALEPELHVEWFEAIDRLDISPLMGRNGGAIEA